MRGSDGISGTAYTNAFDYDGMGNRTRVENVSGGDTRITSSTPNELNQLTALSASVNGASAQTSGLLYDKAGNTSFITNPDGSRTAFSYDDADRLTRIEKINSAGALLSKSEFVYDFASRKAVSREFTRTNGAWVKTDEKRRVFDGLDVVQERNAANEVTAQLVRDGNIGGILARSTAAGASFFGYDGGGNVTLLTDANGDDVGRYRYDAFGNTLEAVGPRAAENPYRFSTKELHAASGLYDFGYRFYSASLGRWINRDPLEEEGGVNLYAMVGNSPVNALDSYGLYKRPGFWAQVGKVAAKAAAVSASIPTAIMFGTLAATAKPASAPTLTGSSTVKSVGLITSRFPGPPKLPPIPPKGSTKDFDCPRLDDSYFPAGLRNLGDRNQKMAEIMGWGTGTPSAISAIAFLDKANLQSYGLTADMARKWYEFYRCQEITQPWRSDPSKRGGISGNPSASGRRILMWYAMKVLGG